MDRTEDITPVDMDLDVFPQVLAALEDPALSRSRRGWSTYQRVIWSRKRPPAPHSHDKRDMDRRAGDPS